jgi:hypothetical protein
LAFILALLVFEGFRVGFAWAWRTVHDPSLPTKSTKAGEKLCSHGIVHAFR